MRVMSFHATTRQMRDRTKRETRRMGWLHAKVGDQVMAVEKGRGIPLDHRQELGIIEFTLVQREPLCHITRRQVADEGYPGESAGWFIEKFCRLNKVKHEWGSFPSWPGSMVGRSRGCKRTRCDAVQHWGGGDLWTPCRGVEVTRLRFKFYTEDRNDG